MNLFQFRDRLQPFDILAETAQVMQATEQEIAEYNRGQMYEGVRADDTTIEPEYSPLTVLIKTAKGQPTDRVTLRDTGDFYDSIKVDVNSNAYEVYATDEKTVRLTTKYGDKILGLSKSSKATYVEQIVRPRLEDVITAKLLL